MTDKPSVALRGKLQSSMVVGLRLQAEGRSDAFVSAGNTGAQMAASKELLSTASRACAGPAICTVFPTAREPGGRSSTAAPTSTARPRSSCNSLAWAPSTPRTFWGGPSPSSDLLSVGEEPEKGNKVVKEAHQLLRRAGLNFQGNVEGRDVLAGASERGPIDVVVCDGFVGNVLLKFYEAVAPLILGLLVAHGFDAAALRPVFAPLDYAERGGAPLLGVRGISIISHGKSSEQAIKNAIKVALRAVETQLSDHIGRRLASGTAASGASTEGGGGGGAAGGAGASATPGRAAASSETAKTARPA